MSDFKEKAVFIWQTEAICSGDVEKIADAVVAAGFEGAHLHSVYQSTWNNPLRVSLVQVLKARGLAVYGSTGIYGAAPVTEGLTAAKLVNDYELDGWIFDAEVQFDDQPGRLANTALTCQTYKANTQKPGAWCYWAYPSLHYPAVLAKAMETLEVAMPMVYWNHPSDDSAGYAVRYLEKSFAQWQPYLAGKVYCPAGRAFNGSGLPGLITPAQVAAFDARARELGAAGITWWDMQHAIRLPEIWRALCETPKFNGGGVTPPPTGGSMWNDNFALIAAFDPAGGAPAPASIDFAALKAAGIDAALINLGGSSDTLNYAEPYAGAVENTARYQRIADAKAAGVLAIGEYSYSPVMDSLNYTGQWVEKHLNYLTSGQGKPQGGVLLTCERYQWKEGSATKDCVPSMFVQDLKAVTGWMYKTLGLVPGVRTGRWFIDAAKINLADGYMDLVNNGTDTLPLFGVYLTKSKATVTGSFRDLLKDLPDPEITTVQISKDASGNPIMGNLQAHYLYIGNYTRWRGWEFAWVYHPGVLDAAGKPALFRVILWRGDAKDLYGYFNVPVPGTEPPPPPPPPPPAEDKWEAARAAGYAWIDALIAASKG